jgi:hypothetical protein
MPRASAAVHDLFVIGEQTHRHVVPDPVAAFDRPDPVRPLPGICKQRLVAGTIGVA